MLPNGKQKNIPLYSLCIVNGYMNTISIQREIPENIVDLIVLFYHRYFTEIGSIKPTPLSLLCAIYDAHSLLHSHAVKRLDIIRQIKFLKSTITIEELCHHQNESLYEPLEHIVLLYRTKAQALLKAKDISQWTSHDMIISYMYYLTNVSTDVFDPNIWTFVSYFRTYCHDLEYNGMDLLMLYQKTMKPKNVAFYITKKICSKYSLKLGPFSGAKKTFIQWIKRTIQPHTIQQLCNTKKTNMKRTNAAKMTIGTGCNMITVERDVNLVHGFVRGNLQRCAMEDISNVYHTCFIFYGGCFVDLVSITPTPFTVLFAVYLKSTLLRVDGWKTLNIVKQCQYLRTQNTGHDLMHTECDVDDEVLNDLKAAMSMYHEENRLRCDKPIQDWNRDDIITSLISFCVELITNDKVPSARDSSLWIWIDEFRKYLHSTQYDGQMFTEYITQHHEDSNHSIVGDVCWRNKLIMDLDKCTTVTEQWSKCLYYEYIDNRSVHEDEKADVRHTVTSTGQQFLYKTNCAPPLSNHLLVSGYTRYECDDYGIPKDVRNIIEQFYGKTYMIYGDGPSENEFDYAVEFLVPMKRIGINLNKTETKITNCSSSFAQKNIIPDSDIIQVNHTYVKDMNLSVQENDDLWTNLKQNGNAFVVFRAQKELNEKGTHFMFDIKMKQKEQTKAEKFPFDKFDATATIKIFKSLWSDHEMDVLDLYSNKQCLSGGHGVCLLLFVDGNVSCTRYKKLKMNSLIQQAMGRRFYVELSYTMNGLKGYGINTPWSSIAQSYWEMNTKPLRDLIYLVRGVDDGRNAWYYVLVEMDKLEEFLKALKDDIIHLENFGVILYSAYGADAPQDITDKLKKIWKIRD